MPRNYYVILGVPADATSGDIKAAYRQRALDLHPDRTGTDSAPFRELQEAYEVLSDPGRRQAYDDRTHPRRHAPTPVPKAGPEPLRPRPSTSGRSAPPRPTRPPGATAFRRTTASVDIALTPDEAARGGQIELRLPSEQTCPACGGVGSSFWRLCRQCFGAGLISTARSVVVGFPARTRNGHQVPVPLRDGQPGRWLMVRFFVAE